MTTITTKPEAKTATLNEMLAEFVRGHDQMDSVNLLDITKKILLPARSAASAQRLMENPDYRGTQVPQVKSARLIDLAEDMVNDLLGMEFNTKNNVSLARAILTQAGADGHFDVTVKNGTTLLWNKGDGPNDQHEKARSLASRVAIAAYRKATNNGGTAINPS